MESLLRLEMTWVILSSLPSSTLTPSTREIRPFCHRLGSLPSLSTKYLVLAEMSSKYRSCSCKNICQLNLQWNMEDLLLKKVTYMLCHHRFVKSEAELQYNLPLTHGLIVQASLVLGTMKSLNDLTRINDRFLLGKENIHV